MVHRHGFPRPAPAQVRDPPVVDHGGQRKGGGGEIFHSHLFRTGVGQFIMPLQYGVVKRIEHFQLDRMSFFAEFEGQGISLRLRLHQIENRFPNAVRIRYLQRGLLLEIAAEYRKFPEKQRCAAGGGIESASIAPMGRQILRAFQWSTAVGMPGETGVGQFQTVTQALVGKQKELFPLLY